MCKFCLVPSYDFKGNPLLQLRSYAEDATTHPDWTAIGSVIMETAVQPLQPLPNKVSGYPERGLYGL